MAGGAGAARGTPSVLTALVLAGLLLRTWAYLAGTPLWLDEILLARNILTLPLGDLLTRPLYLDQVAPPGFLLLEKLAVRAFGGGEHALRLVPFLFGVAGLFLFRRLAERALEPAAAAVAVGLYAIAVPFIRYAAEVKQYELDATVAILLLLVALDLRGRERSTRRLVLTGLAGLPIVLVSQAAVLVMAGIGLAFLVLWATDRDRGTARVLLLTMPPWALAAGCATLLGTRSMTPSTREFMHDFWGQGFLPRPVRWPGAAEWIWTQLQSVFIEPALLRYPWPPLYLAVALVGVAVLWRSRRDVALFLLGPFTVAVLASAAQQYPFRGRLMLYLVPGLLLTIAAGAGWGRQALGGVTPAGGWAALFALVLPPVAALLETPPPYQIEDHRTILAYLARQHRPGDSIYVFPLSRIGMLYYGPRYGIRPGQWTTSVCDRYDTRAWLRDVDRYRGVQRLWVLSSNGRPYRSARPAVRNYLATVGVRRDSLMLPSLTFETVSLELYDLSDSARLRAVSAATFPVLPMPTDPRPGCRPWARPSPSDTFP
ncbi:MAG TPA: glycosyltransferase family 39 protein [Gemmatimonadales bacterium]|nr:glycosyltransferase family 39 protein [Gemmatimonadales bacterium]